MSASSTPTRSPIAARPSARLAAVVDLPTPPLPDATAMIAFTPGTSGCCAWGLAPNAGGGPAGGSGGPAPPAGARSAGNTAGDGTTPGNALTAAPPARPPPPNLPPPGRAHPEALPPIPPL